MERKVVTYAGSELSDFILGKLNQDGSRTYSNFEFRWEPPSSPSHAYDRAKRISGNPNYRPWPFKMPSAMWDFSTNRAYYIDSLKSRPDYFNATEEEKFEATNPPKYLINGWTRLGGSVDEFTASISNVDVNSDIYINDTTFNDTLLINYLVSKYYIRFNNCVFKDTVNLLYSQIDQVSFSHCQFESGLFVTNCDINNLAIEGNSVVKNINIKIDAKEDYPLRILQNDMPHKVEILRIKDTNVEEKLEVIGRNIGSIAFDQATVKQTVIRLEQPSINISSDSKKHIVDQLEYTCTAGETPSSYAISNLSIENLKLDGFINSDDVFKITSCDVKRFQFQDFANGGKFVLNDVRVSDELIIDKSDLAEALFIGVNLRSVRKCEIIKSNIIEISLYNTSFSNNINEKNDSLYEIRDIYRQLKYASSKQNDRLNELRYEAVESSVIRKILENGNDKDKWIFKFNDWSSRHGQDWVRAGSKLFWWGLACFGIIQLLMGYINFMPQLIFENIANFIAFLNPIHKFSEIFGEPYTPFGNGLAMFIDAVFKLFSAYMLFQFLRAFRKYFRS
ncbi:hypothetical protein CLV58_113126 [Spirosoma oryzae]|uniref:Pentapeptide repeat protein n=1 Tax=Spirosoma oryzae TaxID=1469603 RepID=A0A2T0SRF1_9BACT|nr:hypothetical protein [Spirosoma oryzae]PRY35995.1 hypothetical protein CLV58_113126 [Spirosoma oryzae]